MDQVKANLIENFIQYPAICVVKTAVSTSHKKNQEFHQFSYLSWQWGILELTGFNSLHYQFENEPFAKKNDQGSSWARKGRGFS